MVVAQREKSAPSNAKLVGHAFVEQYYILLHEDIEQVHRFYKDSSVLSRPGPGDKMTAVTTMQEINEKILSMDYSNCRVEILTADSQASYQDGYIVVVTGILTRKESVGKKFVQTFFLAPQENGYFVLNDILKFVEDIQLSEPDITPADVEDVAEAVVDVPSEQAEVADQNVVDKDSVPEIDADNKDEVSLLPSAEGEETKTTEKEPVVVDDGDSVKSSPTEVPPVAAESLVSAVKENIEKKSYASLVNEMKSNFSPFNVKASPAKPPAQTTEAAVLRATNSQKKNNDNGGKGHTIFVGGLPMNATPNQLREVFTKFGPTQPNGVKVRSSRGLCFGFVEFESSTSLEEALKATDVLVGGYKVIIEIAKRNRDSDQGNNGRGRFPPGPAGRFLPGPAGRFRNDNYRGPRNFGGHYARRKFGRQSEFSLHNQRNAEAKQNVETYRNVGGRGARQAVNA